MINSFDYVHIVMTRGGASDLQFQLCERRQRFKERLLVGGNSADTDKVMNVDKRSDNRESEDGNEFDSTRRPLTGDEV
jgi:hypothetical protein